MLKGLLKIFLGDNGSSDLKEIQPIVDEILIAEKELLSISADELRAKTSLLRSRITDFVSELQNEIDTLLEQAASMPESNLDAKEAVFVRVDKLEEEINEQLEVVLAEILPEAFAVVKETAKRFAVKEDIEVTVVKINRGPQGVP